MQADRGGDLKTVSTKPAAAHHGVLRFHLLCAPLFRAGVLNAAFDPGGNVVESILPAPQALSANTVRAGLIDFARSSS